MMLRWSDTLIEAFRILAINSRDLLIDSRSYKITITYIMVLGKVWN